MAKNLRDLLAEMYDATMTDATAAGDPPHLNPNAGPGKPDCPICGGIGYIRRDVPFGHKDFGKLSPCPCRQDDIRAAQENRLARLASLGPLADRTFVNFLPEGQATDTQQRGSLRWAFEFCQRFAEQPRGWIFLSGGYGCGKTHLAAAIANHRLQQGDEVIFTTVPDLLDHLRATYAPNAAIAYDDLFDRLRTTDLLILDDLGAESPTPWAQEKLYQLISHRYNAKLPTVITSNADLDRIEGRIRSRLVDADLVRNIIIDAPDFRRGFAESQHRLSSLELHHHQTFDTFDASRKGELLEPPQITELRAAFEAARSYAANPEGWLVLVGSHGNGKTHLAAAIANDQGQAGRRALFVTCADLLDHLRATFNPESTQRYDKLFTEVRNAPFLVLDDLVLEGASPWAREKLIQLLDHRYVARLPTVITTAADKYELGDKLESRVLDRRQHVICIITAPVYKGGAATPTRPEPERRPPTQRGGTQRRPRN